MSPIALKEFAGNAQATRLSGQLASGTTASFAVVTNGGTGFPTGATAPFVVVIDRATALEEKILVATRSSDTFTTLTRGYDGTTAQTHAAQAVVEHVYDSVAATEASAHANTTSRDDHTQYTNNARHDVTARHAFGAALGTPAAASSSAIGDAAATGSGAVPARSDHVHGREAALRRSITFGIPGEVFVPSGDVDYVLPVFIPINTGRTCKLIAARHRINSGTSATVKLQKNAVDITGFTALSVTTTSTLTDPADVTLADGDMIALVVTAVAGNPKNLSFSIYLEDS